MNHDDKEKLTRRIIDLLLEKTREGGLYWQAIEDAETTEPSENHLATNFGPYRAEIRHVEDHRTRQSESILVFDQDRKVIADHSDEHGRVWDIRKLYFAAMESRLRTEAKLQEAVALLEKL